MFASQGTYDEDVMIKRQQTTSTDISEQFIEVFPNPADFIVTIRLKEDLPTSEMCKLVVTDVMGREVLSQQVKPSQHVILLNTNKWVSGTYAFRILIPHLPIEINGKFDVVH
ncbi:MAG: Secretion system C-terminal sorting domain [Bacteroidota bacterium]